METLKLRPSARKLVETGIQLKNSPDNRQVAYGLDFIQTAIKEVEDEHKLKEDNGGAHRDQGGEKDVEKAIHEADEITGELDSHQSSDIDMPYKKEGTDEPQSDIESMQSASGENQMGGIKEGMPPNGMPQPGMGPGMQMPGMPPIAPDVQQAMQPKMPPMPQMNTQQMLRQMQYTVEANFKRLNPLIREVKKLREAVIAQDKKVKELESQKGALRLDIDKVKNNSIVRNHPIQETTLYDGVTFPKPTEFNQVALEQKRLEIANLDRELSKASPYQ